MWKCVTFARKKSGNKRLITIHIFQYLDETNRSEAKRNSFYFFFFFILNLKSLIYLHKSAAKVNNSKRKWKFSTHFWRFFLSHSQFSPVKGNNSISVLYIVKVYSRWRNWTAIQNKMKSHANCKCVYDLVQCSSNWFLSCSVAYWFVQKIAIVSKWSWISLGIGNWKWLFTKRKLWRLLC